MLLLRTAAASDKMTKPQAEYQDTPNGIYSCGLCTLFVAPDGCKVVEGTISEDWLVQGLCRGGLSYFPLEGRGGATILAHSRMRMRTPVASSRPGSGCA